MSTPSPTFPETSNVTDPMAPRSPRGLGSELSFLGSTYLVTFFIGSMFISMCGPGCCYVLFSILAGVSGLLMLRQPFTSRCICLTVLLLSIVGMWHEKETRETWNQRASRLQIETLEQELHKLKSK